MNKSLILKDALKKHLEMIQLLDHELPLLERIAERMSHTILDGHKILWCGNGGSAADSQHLAAEFVGRFLKERQAGPSIALTTNTSILTAIGNDYGYEYVFRRQAEALCTPKDVLVGISTSGNSKNVCLALEAGKQMGVFTVAFTGQGGGLMAEIADETLRIPSVETPRIQEAHILCGHMLCDYVEQYVTEREAAEASEGAS